MSWIDGARARLVLLLSARRAEARFSEEIEFHIDMETERLRREEGLSADDARRRALIAFGGVVNHKEALHDGRGLRWLGGLSLDFRLGLRMLVKYPGLTIVGSIAMAFAIWVGAVTFEMVTLLLHPRLPLPGGDRIVQIHSWDMAASEEESRTLHDFAVWRGSLTTLTDLGAYRTVTRNLFAVPGDARPVPVAEITASGFRVAPAPPLMGRALVATDEGAGAPPVVVIGYDVWRNRFASRSDIVGRSVQVGDAYATVVGVMPKGFAFPASHDAWMPLRTDLLDQPPREGPAINVFGRLAPGRTLEEAQAELTALGRRAAVQYPTTHEHLQPRVLPYTQPFPEKGPGDLAASLAIQLFALTLLVLVCSNVALLLFARAATRENELIVRSALGATRGRIIAQLFTEALVLGGVAAAIGLAATHFGLQRWGREFLEMNMGRLPFWYDPHLSPTTVLYALALTVLSAVIAGVGPALKVTRGLGTRLRSGTAGGGLRFGGIWTAVIVTQVAFTVAFPAVVYFEQSELRRIRSVDVGFPAKQYLAVQLEADEARISGAATAATRNAERARLGATLELLRERVASEPGVDGVTFVDHLPRLYHPQRRIELDEPSEARSTSPTMEYAGEVNVASVDPSYFEVLNAPILAGRAFHAGETGPDSRVAIVDQGFVDQVLSGRSAIGRRVRFVRNSSSDDESRPWYEIVGVVKELGTGGVTQAGRAAGFYLPTAPESVAPLQMLVHVRGDPTSFIPRVRAIAAAVDPTLRLSDLQRLDLVARDILWVIGLWLRSTVLLTAVAVMLSLCGIYAVLSFTVARRTREIGVRVALGASRRRVVTDIFRRPMIQFVLGIGAGTLLIAVAIFALRGRQDGRIVGETGLSIEHVGLLAMHATIMLGVGLLACIVPTCRALRVEPTEALRTD
jgi:predicted permease